MLVMSEREWRARNRQQVRGTVRRLGIVLLVTYVVMLVLLAGLWMDEPLARPLPLVMAVLFGATVLGSWMMVLLASLRAVERGPVVGLYRGGVQVNQFFFLPYEEISSFDLKGWGLERGKVPVVYFRTRYKPRGLARLTTPSALSVRRDMLTEEGLEELDRRVRGVPPEESPPRLVLYGPRSRR